MRQALTSLVVLTTAGAMWQFTTTVVPMPLRPDRRGGVTRSNEAGPVLRLPLPAPGQGSRSFPAGKLVVLDHPDMSGPPAGSEVVRTAAPSPDEGPPDGPPDDPVAPRKPLPDREGAGPK